MKINTKLSHFIRITFGTLLMVAGIYFFKFPNNFSTGGVSGISTVLSGIFPGIPISGFVLVINIALLLLGFCTLGKGFGFNTVYCSLLLSFGLSALEHFCPLSAPLTNQPLLELIFAVLLTALGSAVLFNAGASTGGTDIIAMLLRRTTQLNVGRALLFTDALIVVAAAFVFGPETGLFSVLGLLAKAFFVDNVIESMNTSKFFIIVTNHPDSLCAFIHKELHRGATVCDCTGSFEGTGRSLVLSVMNRAQALRLKNYMKENDPKAFMVITGSSDIIGKGFRTTM